jgi:CRP-like cAMP-binding protein
MIEPEILRKLEFFRPFNEQELQSFSPRLDIAEFEAQKEIFGENQIGDNSMYVLIEGAVKITKKHKTEEKVLASIKEGEFFGEMAMLLPAPRSASAVTMKPCRLIQLTDGAYSAFKREYPAIAVKLNEIFLKTLVQRLREADKRLVKEGHGIGEV